MKFIIIGAGDVGTSLAESLTSHQHDVFLIEKDEERIERISSSLDVQFIEGSGCDANILASAGINTADYVIAVTEVDEINLAVCLMARLMNPEAKRVARIRDLSLEHKDITSAELSEYFDLLINPARAGAEYFMRLFEVPGAKEFFECGGGRMRVIGITVDPESPLANKKLTALREMQTSFPVLLIAIVRGTKLIVPRGTDKIRVGDVVYTITVPEKIPVIFELAGKELHEGKSAIIWGGTPLSRYLAQSLEKRGVSLKIILSDPDQAEDMADMFQNALVLRGSGTDHNLLIEENIYDVDAFIAATPDEEDNILASLLAKRLGAKTAMCLVNQTSYLPLVTSIGVDAAISSRRAAAQAIFRHIHSDSIVSQFSLRNQGAGFIEIELEEKMPLVGKPIAELNIPYGILLAGLVRGSEVIIPTGADVPEVGDRAVIFVVRTAVKKLEKLLRVKVELFG